MTRRNLWQDADSRARLIEATSPTAATRRQRTAINRTLRRLGWHTTPLTKVKPR